jgi:hypothetical protein
LGLIAPSPHHRVLLDILDFVTRLELLQELRRELTRISLPSTKIVLVIELIGNVVFLLLYLLLFVLMLLAGITLGRFARETIVLLDLGPKVD